MERGPLELLQRRVERLPPEAVEFCSQEQMGLTQLQTPRSGVEDVFLAWAEPSLLLFSHTPQQVAIQLQARGPGDVVGVTMEQVP